MKRRTGDPFRMATRGTLLGIALLFVLFFLPRLIADGALYYEYARSLAIDGDLNFANERAFYTWRFNPVFPSYGVGLEEGGYPHHTFNIGPGLLFAPLLVLGHLAARIAEAAGAPIVADGYSFPARILTCLTAFPLALAGLAATLRSVREVAGAETGRYARQVVLLVAACSALPAMVLISPAFSHATSYCFSALFLLYAVRWFGKARPPRVDFATGLLVGLAALARTQCGLLALLFLAEPFERVRSGRDVRHLLASYVRMGSAALLAFSPQIVSNLILFGKPIVDPQGEGGMVWLHPRSWLILFDSEHGLFATTPFFLPIVFGLPLLLFRRRSLGAGLLLAVFVQFYLNAVRRDWAGIGFGPRRYLTILPIFTLAAVELVRRIGRLGIARRLFLGVGVFFAVFNFSMMGQYYLTDLSSPDVSPGFLAIAERSLVLAPRLIAGLAARGLAVGSLLHPGLVSFLEAAVFLCLLGGIVALALRPLRIPSRWPLLLAILLFAVDLYLVFTAIDTRLLLAYPLRPPETAGEPGRTRLTSRRPLILRRKAFYEGLLEEAVNENGCLRFRDSSIRYTAAFFKVATVSWQTSSCLAFPIELDSAGRNVGGIDLVLAFARDRNDGRLATLSLAPDGAEIGIELASGVPVVVRAEGKTAVVRRPEPPGEMAWGIHIRLPASAPNIGIALSGGVRLEGAALEAN